MSILIRPMTLDDVPAVCAVDRECIRPPWSPDTFQSELQSTAGCYLVAEEDGELLGYLGSSMILDEAHVTTLGVHPRARRLHVGERLFQAMLQEAVRRKVRRVTLEVRERNEAAQGLYRKYGFEPLSRRKRYYQDNDEDAIVMWIEDTSRYGFRQLLKERVEALSGK